MDNKKFTLWNRVTAVVVTLIAAVTYILTLEPTASFWDCGEFIASSYKLEVGHPPGNPVFQLFARLFTIFADNIHKGYGDIILAGHLHALNALHTAIKARQVSWQGCMDILRRDCINGLRVVAQVF